jgi:hypothetical protein
VYVYSYAYVYVYMHLYVYVYVYVVYVYVVYVYTDENLQYKNYIGGFIKGILRGVRCTKSLRVLFLHRRPPTWTTLVLYSRAVFIFNEPALCVSGRKIKPFGNSIMHSRRSNGIKK